MLESAFRLSWHEDCIRMTQRYLKESNSITALARIHFILAKSVLSFYDLLKLEVIVDADINEAKVHNLELAIDNLIKAVELDPNQTELQNELKQSTSVHRRVISQINQQTVVPRSVSLYAEDDDLEEGEDLEANTDRKLLSKHSTIKKAKSGGGVTASIHDDVALI